MKSRLRFDSTVMLLPILATVIRLIMLIEYPYLRRYRVKPTRDWDKHSAKLWDIANLIEPVGMVLGFTNIGRIQTGTYVIGSLGLLFLVGGITIRWAAIYTLGKYFTGTVLIKTLDASGGSVFLNLLGAAKFALIRAAASTQPLGVGWRPFASGSIRRIR